MEEEIRLRQRYGTEMPFKVPEGYFESITKRTMAALPEQEVKAVTIPLWKRWSSMVAVAAAVCGVLFGVVVWMNRSMTVSADSSEALSANSVSASDGQIDEMADYLMLDDDDIYSYIAEN